MSRFKDIITVSVGWGFNREEESRRANSLPNGYEPGELLVGQQFSFPRQNGDVHDAG